jgi:hypothetical protein
VDRLETELTREMPMSTAAKARLLSALRAELPKAPSKNRWRFEVAGVVASSFLVTASIAGALLTSGNTTMEIIAARAVVLVMGGLICAYAAAVAIAPGLKRGQVFALAAFAVGAAVLVGMRSEISAASTPEWVCTATHVGVGAIPLVIGVFALRRSGSKLLAGLALGVSAGTTGAMVGELGCGRDALHVLLFHVSAWLMMVAVGALLSLVIRPRSHAP